MRGASEVSQAQLLEVGGGKGVHLPAGQLRPRLVRRIKGSAAVGLNGDARFAAHVVAFVEYNFDAHYLRQVVARVIRHLLDLGLKPQLGDAGGGRGHHVYGDGGSRCRHGSLAVRERRRPQSTGKLRTGTSRVATRWPSPTAPNSGAGR